MDLDAYRDQLRIRLDSMRLQQEPRPGSAIAQSQSILNPMGEAAPQMASLESPPSNAPTIETAGSGGQAQPQFNSDSLEGAKSFSDVMKAMKPKSRSEYMDWWEGQYGSINAKWDALQSELGQRPDPKGKLSRKEKFQLLMEFGLELMRASQPGQDQGGGATTAAYNAVRNVQADRKSDQRDFDVRNQLLLQGRQRDLTAIGSRGQAMAAQSRMDTDETQRAKYQADMMKPQKRQYLTTDQGVMDVTSGSPSPLTLDGKPLTNLKVGGRGGQVRDFRPSEQKKYEHLLSVGVRDEVALRLAYKERTGDPRKDYKDVFNATMRATSDTDEAKAAAQEYVDMAYGVGAIENAKVPDINKPNDGPKKITTQAEYDALPSGTKYIDPNGKTRQKK